MAMAEAALEAASQLITTREVSIATRQTLTEAGANQVLLKMAARG